MSTYRCLYYLRSSGISLSTEEKSDLYQLECVISNNIWKLNLTTENIVDI